MTGANLWEAEFLFALRNRTGKYFIGRDILDDLPDFFAQVRYGRAVVCETPTGIKARMLAIAAEREIGLRVRHPNLPGRIRRHRPVLHLDPLTVPLYEIGPQDAVLCHDLGPITHAELFAPGVADLYRAAYTQTAARNPRMIFVSQASRDAYAEHFGVPERARVIYPPIRAEVAKVSPIPVDGLRAPFLLTVGALGNRKNQKTAIEAFARSGLSRQGWSYVLCGTREPGAEAVVELAGRTEGVTLLSYVPDGALVWLYRNARGFVLTSHLEGFGIPLAEAIAAGLVPIVTRDSVLEEVAGDGALSVDPDDPDDIARSMNELVAMSSENMARRKDLLATSVSRFNHAAFISAWRAILSDRPASEAIEGCFRD